LPHPFALLRRARTGYKNLHLAALGREYGNLDVTTMIVPAWDFDHRDAWLEAGRTLVHDIENGHVVLRASREGLLIASDAYGRVFAPNAQRTAVLRLAASRLADGTAPADAAHPHRQPARLALCERADPVDRILRLRHASRA